MGCFPFILSMCYVTFLDFQNIERHFAFLWFHLALLPWGGLVLRDPRSMWPSCWGWENGRSSRSGELAAGAQNQAPALPQCAGMDRRWLEKCFLCLTPWSPEPAAPWAMWAPFPGGEGKKSLSGSVRRGSASLDSLLKEKTSLLRSRPMCVWATRNSTTLIKIRDQQVGLIYYLQEKPPSICIII